MGNYENHLFKLVHAPRPTLLRNNPDMALTQNADDLGIGLVVMHVYRIPKGTHSLHFVY